MMTAISRRHALERTSPKGQAFIATCTQCGRTGLTIDDFKNGECENIRGLTQEEAIMEAIVGPTENPHD